MSEPKIVTCPNCGQKTRVQPAAAGVPHCAKCGRPLPWLSDVGVADFNSVVEKSPIPVLIVHAGKHVNSAVGNGDLAAESQPAVAQRP